MTLARKCEGCGGFIDGEYYDVMITKKDSSEEPDQNRDHYYGDYCIKCLKDGTAIRNLLQEIK